MTTETMEQENEVSSLGMSDDDFAKLDPSQFDKAVAEPEAVVEEEPEEETAAEEAEGEGAAPAEPATEDADAAEDKEDEAAEEEAAVEKDVAEEKPVTEKTEAKQPEVAVDYKSEYDRLLTPFKANGKEIAVGSVDDAIALMQMGANYNKKMAALKPNLKLMKLLENNGLLSEEKLSFLIDLEKKSPEAISKLIKDSGMDPMDLDADKASGYKPKTYTVDEREMELDTVLDELQSTPTYNRTLDIVSNKWDGPSKQVIANSPQLLKVINDHVQSGIYDTIIKEVERERVFGRLNGLSDIEAYRHVGDAIQARGGFASVGNPEQRTATAPVVVTPKPKTADDDKLRDKKRAASSTKPVAPTSVAKDFNPLALSDEEFSKQVNSKYL